MPRKRASLVDVSPEQRTWDAFALIKKEHDEEDDKSMKLLLATEADPDNKAKGKKFRASMARLDVLVKRMFTAYDAWDRTRKHSIHVPQADIEQITYDALMTNADAFPGDDGMTGLERGRAMKNMAQDLYASFKESRTRIFEEDIGPAPLCAECE